MRNKPVIVILALACCLFLLALITQVCEDMAQRQHASTNPPHPIAGTLSLLVIYPSGLRHESPEHPGRMLTIALTDTLSTQAGKVYTTHLDYDSSKLVAITGDGLEAPDEFPIEVGGNAHVFYLMTQSLDASTTWQGSTALVTTTVEIAGGRSGLAMAIPVESMAAALGRLIWLRVMELSVIIGIVLAVIANVLDARRRQQENDAETAGAAGLEAIRRWIRDFDQNPSLGTKSIIEGAKRENQTDWDENSRTHAKLECTNWFTSDTFDKLLQIVSKSLDPNSDQVNSDFDTLLEATKEFGGETYKNQLMSFEALKKACIRPLNDPKIVCDAIVSSWIEFNPKSRPYARDLFEKLLLALYFRCNDAYLKNLLVSRLHALEPMLVRHPLYELVSPAILYDFTLMAPELNLPLRESNIESTLKEKLADMELVFPPFDLACEDSASIKRYLNHPNAQSFSEPVSAWYTSAQDLDLKLGFGMLWQYCCETGSTQNQIFALCSALPLSDLLLPSASQADALKAIAHLVADAWMRLLPYNPYAWQALPSEAQIHLIHFLSWASGSTSAMSTRLRDGTPADQYRNEYDILLGVIDQLIDEIEAGTPAPDAGQMIRWLQLRPMKLEKTFVMLATTKNRTSQAASQAQLLEQLIPALDACGVYLKLFTPDLNISLQNVHAAELKWSDRDLKDLLDRRVSIASGETTELDGTHKDGKVKKFASLFKDTQTSEVLIQRLIQASGGSPSRLLVLVGKTLQSSFDRSQADNVFKIEKLDVDAAIQSITGK